MPTSRSSRLYPFLWYTKDAEKAARFYASIFPNSRVHRVTTMPSDSPSGPAGSVKVVDFTLLGQRFTAMAAGKHHPFNDAFSITVLCRNQKELDRYWKALTSGGGKAVACGWLNDKYGVRWQIVPEVFESMIRDRNRVRAKRVTDAMMTMVKFDIAALKKAWRG